MLRAANSSARGYVVCRTSARRLLQIVSRLSQLHVGPEQQPVRARVLERHPDAAGVHDARRADLSIELHVRVPAHDQRRVHAGKDRQQPLLRRQPRENLEVVARCGMADEHVPQPLNLDPQRQRPARKQLLILATELRGGPADDVAKRLRHLGRFLAVHLRADDAIAVAVDELHRHIERQKPGDGFVRHRPGEDVAADDDALDASGLDLLEHRLERRKVAVDVGDHCDADSTPARVSLSRMAGGRVKVRVQVGSERLPPNSFLP